MNHHPGLLFGIRSFRGWRHCVWLSGPAFKGKISRYAGWEAGEGESP